MTDFENNNPNPTNPTPPATDNEPLHPLKVRKKYGVPAAIVGMFAAGYLLAQFPLLPPQQTTSAPPEISQTVHAATSPSPAPSGTSDGNYQITPPVPLPEQTSPTVAVAQKTLASTVKVVAGTSSGSGFFIDTEGTVLTNNHVVESALETGTDIYIITQDGNRHPARIVGTTPAFDLAVLDTDLKTQPLSFADSSQLQVGTEVLAVGSPLGLSGTVTSGIVSALNRPVALGQAESTDPNTPPSEEGRSYVVGIQTDAPVNPGNSGGPLVDLAGNVVGINTAIASTNGGSVGLGFAIPATTASRIAYQLANGEEIKPGRLGALVRGQEDQPGVVVEQVSDKPAQGALEKGDVILRYNGNSVSSAEDLVAFIRTTTPGTKVTLDVLRNGKQTPVELTITS